MKRNVSLTDRWVRFILGIILLSLVFTNLPYHYLGYIGLVLIISGLFRFCPLYTLFGINTCPVEKKK